MYSLCRHFSRICHRLNIPVNFCTPIHLGGHRGRDHMVVGFITTYAISAFHH